MKRLTRLSATLALLIAASMSPGVSQAQEEPAHQHQQPPAEPDARAHHAHGAAQPTESEKAHIPPSPPTHAMRDMSEQEMAEMMDMDDTAGFGMMLLDELEWRDTDDGSASGWDGRAWYGNDYDKLLLKSEGERADGESEGFADLLWDRVISRWWSVQAGLSHSFAEGPSRTWAAVGLQGLAPYWFEIEATLYVGEAGRTAARFSGEYELFLTQRLVLQPKLELDLFGKDDVANGTGAGLSDAELGLRLRYEIRREFAPYVGVLWSRLLGGTADLARDEGREKSDVQVVAGLRMWF